jgi:hypothetical protein
MARLPPLIKPGIEGADCPRAPLASHRVCEASIIIDGNIKRADFISNNFLSMEFGRKPAIQLVSPKRSVANKPGNEAYLCRLSSAQSPRFGPWSHRGIPRDPLWRQSSWEGLISILLPDTPAFEPFVPEFSTTGHELQLSVRIDSESLQGELMCTKNPSTKTVFPEAARRWISIWKHLSIFHKFYVAIDFALYANISFVNGFLGGVNEGQGGRSQNSRCLFSLRPPKNNANHWR